MEHCKRRMQAMVTQGDFVATSCLVQICPKSEVFQVKYSAEIGRRFYP